MHRQLREQGCGSGRLTSTSGEENVFPLIQYHAQNLLLFNTEENLVQFSRLFRCHVSRDPIWIPLIIAVEQKVWSKGFHLPCKRAGSTYSVPAHGARLVSLFRDGPASISDNMRSIAFVDLVELVVETSDSRGDTFGAAG